MDSASLLYERLGQIPQDPEDPESLEDLLVCAFGAFKRYYICWKTRGGEFRQDGYDLPDALQDWLYPPDGSTRDFPTLQVIFGRGEEYFASDKDGKLEHKEPEVMKSRISVENLGALGQEETPALRRSRTSSDTTGMESLKRSSRSSSISQTSSRPTSTSSSRPSSSSRPTSGAIVKASNPMGEVRDTQRSTPNVLASVSRIQHATSSSVGSITEPPTITPESSTPGPTRLVRRSTRPLSMTFNPGTFPRIVEEKRPSLPRTADEAVHHCPCCRDTSKPSYVDASVQTDPEPLRVDIFTSTPFDHELASSLDNGTPFTDDVASILPPPNPVYLGRMLDYFGNPGYQLGDSLLPSHGYYHQEPVYQEDIAYEQNRKGDIC